MATPDRFSRFNYSHMINWAARLEREWPFLESVLAAAPSKEVLDLGSGTGEHARYIASKGYRVTGIDSSESMVEKARAADGADVRFLLGDMRNPADSDNGPFGAAICLGNALPHLNAEDDLARFASGLRRVLYEGAPVVIQLLNYARIEAKKERSLPVTFHPDPDDPNASLVFLRFMEERPGRRMIFMPTIARLRADYEPPFELITSERVEVRGWRAEELQETFAAAGFSTTAVWGSYQREEFVASESRDVIFLAIA